MLEIHRTSYITFNTPQFLIKRYAETTSRIEKNHFDANAENLKSESPTGYYENIDVNISLITLNCSILEGIIRHSFSSILISDQMKMGDIIESTTDVNNLNVLIRARRLIEDIQINIETQSAWSLLIKSIQSYSDINIKNIADVRYDVISAIFSMRNCFAHGTAITLSRSVEVENEYLV